MPLIETPTRITMNSETLSDNIFMNVVGSRIERGCFFADITDHLPIFMLTNIRLPKNKKIIPEKISRKISNEGINSAKYELNRLDWTPVYSAANANESYNIFLSLFIPIIDKYLPLKKCRVYKNKIRKPWVYPKTSTMYKKEKQTVQNISTR